VAIFVARCWVPSSLPLPSPQGEMVVSAEPARGFRHPLAIMFHGGIAFGGSALQCYRNFLRRNQEPP
jgi:hypothetical protein